MHCPLHHCLTKWRMQSSRLLSIVWPSDGLHHARGLVFCTFARVRLLYRNEINTPDLSPPLLSPVLLRVCEMGLSSYKLMKTHSKHHDSINALAFSHDGSLFASGADDGHIIVFQGNGSGREVRRFQVKAPVATLLWRSRFGHTIVAGDTSGDVHTICLESSGDVSTFHDCISLW